MRFFFLAIAIAMMGYVPFTATTASANAPARSILSASASGAVPVSSSAIPTAPGTVLVRFHVGADGHPEKIGVIRDARTASLDDETRRAVEAVSCMECAGQDYVITFRY